MSNIYCLSITSKPPWLPLLWDNSYFLLWNKIFHLLRLNLQLVGQHVGLIFSQEHVFCCNINPVPSLLKSTLEPVTSIRSTIYFLLAMNESSRSGVHSNGTSFRSKCLKGAITGVLQKQKATRFINSYQDLTSKIQLGEGKFIIDSMYLGEGLMPFLVNKNPANSMVFLANLNF